MPVEGGPACSDSLSASLSGASAGVRLQIAIFAIILLATPAYTVWAVLER